MKKKGIAVDEAAVLAVTTLPVTAFADTKDEKDDKLTAVTLNEMAHSIFYAPQYVVIEEGFKRQ